MKITYAITVCNEEKSFKKLYETLRLNKQEQDNILVLVDLNKCPVGSDFHEFLLDLHKARYIKLISDNFQGNFADWKNKLVDHPLVGDFCIFLDADELLPPQLIDDLPEIIELNPQVNILGFARQNFVKGITPEYIQKWGWRIDDQQRLNYPDVQLRGLRTGKGIRWYGQVHETLKGEGVTTVLPLEPQYSILHSKDLDRQIKQNNSYETGNYER